MSVPDDAETLIASVYTWYVGKPSRFVPGAETMSEVSRCPLCKETTVLQHNVTFECSCGLSMNRIGNSLRVWR